MLLSLAALSQEARPRSQPYIWKNVQMVGGGFVDGIVCHPTAKDVRYARTVDEHRRKLEYDLYFIRERSFGLYLLTLLRTVAVALVGTSR